MTVIYSKPTIIITQDGISGNRANAFIDTVELGAATATTQAGIATTQAGIATGAAADAQASATAAALYDGPWLDTVAALIADTSLTYSNTAVGSYIRTRKEGFAYKVAASGATDHHLVTAGGVKLYRVSEGVGYRNGGDALFNVSTGGSSSETWVFNSYVNDIADGVVSAAVVAGGSLNDEQYIGFKKNREVLTAIGAAQVWPHLPTGGDLSNLRVFKLSTYNVQTTLTSPASYTAVISGAQVDITLAAGLTSGERLIVEDKAAQVTYTGVRPDYSWIGGGYDNVIEAGVMQQVTGAHHRITGGDHGTILGGSYSAIDGGSYGLVLAGTNNEISSAGGVGSVAAGGYRNRVTGATGTIVGGQENRVQASQATIVGGYRNTVSGTASFVGGRNNTVPAADAIAFGDGNTVSGSYGAVFGRANVVSNAYGYAKGRGAVTTWQGQDVRFAMRDGVALTPQRQHFFIDLSKYTTGTTAELIATLDGVTGITVPASTGWKCKLHIAARGGNLRTASFEVDFLVQRHSTATEIVGTPVTTAFVDAGMGTGLDIAGVSVAISGSDLQITVQPRKDSAVSTLWAGVLEILEVR